MKNFKVFLLLFIIGTVLVSCRKDETPEPVIPPVVNGLNDLKAPEQFSWNTAQSVTIQVTGLKSTIDFSRTLSFTLPDGSTILQMMHSINHDLNSEVVIPTGITSLRMTFGKLTADLPIQNGKVSYSFIPVDNGE